MRSIKKILWIILVLIVFAASFLASRYLFYQGNYEIDYRSLAVFDEDRAQYYLQNADKDIVFRVQREENAAFEYLLTDENGATVQNEAKKFGRDKYDILPPAEGYAEGARYTLTLPDGVTFDSENLMKARILIFCINKKPIERYELKDNVVEIDKVEKNTDRNAINVKNQDVKVGDIILSADENDEYSAYKVINIDGSGVATVADAALDEIFSDLEIYGEYSWDVSKISTNPDLEIEIINNVRQSSFFDALMSSAYADENPKDPAIKVKCKPDDKNDSIDITIKIVLNPGENGLFGINELRNQKVTISLSVKVGLSTKCNINGIANWDVSVTTDAQLTWNVSISFFDKDFIKKDKDLAELFSEDSKFANLIHYHENVRKITQKLNGLAADVTGGELKLFDWKLPIPSVPGLYFSTEVKAFFKLNVAADISIGQSNSVTFTVGMYLIGGEFKTYSNIFMSDRGASVSLSGKANAKVGIKLVLKATFVNDKIANISIEPQVGLYADVYAAVPIAELEKADKRSLVYIYFEPGVYFSADVKAKVNVIAKTFDFSYELFEKKMPIKKLTCGNKKIAMGLSTDQSIIRSVNGYISVPDIAFEYYDVKDGIVKTEILPTEKLRFIANDGSDLKLDDGSSLALGVAMFLDVETDRIKLPDTSVSSGVYITAAYLHTDGMTYSTSFPVLINGSILEGKVSAYAGASTAREMDDATVELYAGNTQTNLLKKTKTDDTGKFDFLVSAGDYTLVISKPGYKTLTSHQSVATGDIVYTEHILLMDDSQSGIGRAGGSVTNAIDGKGLSGVAIKLRTNWNNTSDVNCVYTTTTSSSGKYTVENVPVGYYTVEASKNGYVTGYTNIIVSNTMRDDFDFTITPTLSSGEVRIVLTWGAKPSDLDSHLIGRKPNNGTFNVYYQDMKYRYDGKEIANLDVDDTTSYGPETITILEDIYGTYIYTVHDYSNKEYSNSSALSTSGAVVKVFSGSTQIAVYNVPLNQVGTYWTVFEIDSNRQIKLINKVSNTKPSA